MFMPSRPSSLVLSSKEASTRRGSVERTRRPVRLPRPAPISGPIMLLLLCIEGYREREGNGCGKSWRGAGGGDRQRYQRDALYRGLGTRPGMRTPLTLQVLGTQLTRGGDATLTDKTAQLVDDDFRFDGEPFVIGVGDAEALALRAGAELKRVVGVGVD